MHMHAVAGTTGGTCLLPSYPLLPTLAHLHILRTGATGGVGKRVAQLLLARGRRVRVLVRDVEKGKSLLVRIPNTTLCAR